MRKILILAVLTCLFVACGEKESEKNVVSASDEVSIESIEKDIENVSVYLNSESSANSESSSESEAQSSEDKLEVARALYKKCIACHGAKGDKVAPGSVAQTLIANLSKDEIESSLKGYRAKTLSKGGTAAIMFLQASDLSNKDIEILGEYISSF